MRTPLGAIIILAGFISVVSYAQELPEGKYVFSAPALFGSTGGEARGKLCELEDTEDGYHLIFLNNPLSRGSRITFSLENRRIVFDRSHMSSTEIGRTIKGRGYLNGEAIASGKLTVSAGSPGFLLATRKSSEWSLRPATRHEVRESFAEGLAMAEKLIWSARGIRRPTYENAIKALSSVVGYGFTRKDVPELKRMLESGELSYKAGKFLFHETSAVDAAYSSLPITTNVTTERIDLRGHINAVTNATMQVVVASPPAEANAKPSGVAAAIRPGTVSRPAVVQSEATAVRREALHKGRIMLFLLIVLGVGVLLVVVTAVTICFRRIGDQSP